ncbi:hypothetical protein FLK61_24615 [Paenalkalicoccus suaedae]|uniref:DUF3221 domain-containing protein n=1 Tax=Paenalkalicoccus suaedae TaxID=2592382 RepID=A0A859FB05_9BACI|nr:hypothetical protein [Paenalkalicoccus suaedae]QKS69962.1 hypothetical protein FLK61_24615 [Paenalkalicoccus suaedae]
MKRSLAIIVVFLLAACSQNDASNEEPASLAASTNTTANSADINNEPSTPALPIYKPDPDFTPQSISLEVPVKNTDPTIELIRQFSKERLSLDEYGLFYFDYESDDRYDQTVLLVTSDVNEVADSLTDFAKEITEGEGIFMQTVQIERVEYPYHYLNSAYEYIVNNYEELFTDVEGFRGSGFMAQDNRVHVSVRTLEDVDMEAFNAAFGHTDFIDFEESALGSMTDDDVPIPTSEPDFIGTIKSIYDEGILVGSDIFADTPDATIVDSTGEITHSDLKLGDTVHVWAPPPYLESYPMQGDALFVQRIDN